MTDNQNLKDMVALYKATTEKMDGEYQDRVRAWKRGEIDVMGLAGDQRHCELMAEIVRLTCRIIGPESARIGNKTIVSNSWRLGQAEAALNG